MGSLKDGSDGDQGRRAVSRWKRLGKPRERPKTRENQDEQGVGVRFAACHRPAENLADEMDPLSRKKLNRFRTVAFWEGVSYVLLLGVAMPIKYLGGIPEPVKYVGWAHGVLFILYALFLADVMLRFRWPLKRGALFFLASLLPVAPFFVERSLREEQPA